MGHSLTTLVILLCTPGAFAAFANYNNMLIGERASGMGGAFTALTDDSSAAGFYNPASLVRIEGTTVSASATVFNKFDTTYGESADIVAAGERVNRGFFRTIPSSLGNVYRWKDWAFGISVVVPDYDFFSGNIASNATTQSFLNYTDESLWSGFVASYKWDEKQSFGITTYYTARSLIRSSQDRVEVTPGHEVVTTEEKSIKHNGILFVLGYQKILSPTWRMGLSARTPVINIEGKGSFYQSITDTTNLPSQVINNKNINAQTYIPPRYNIGFAYDWSEQLTFSLDGSYYTGFTYQDLNNPDGADHLEHKDTWNGAFGFEYRFKEPKFDLRGGVFTNNSSFPAPSNTPSQRVGDNLKMIGFSGNIAFHATENAQYTIGGFYHGGDGTSVQKTGNQLQRVTKNNHVFSLMISTSMKF
ncbi:MAG: outer membrane protein transport protein [Bdellovibrionales bacterium]|nr:outer membrane protein transport protein [Bdellovibrionales bacterium]